MERPEAEDAPLADESGPVPDDMPLRREDETAATRPDRTDEQKAEPRPDDRT
jgi:hypothetical protein